MTIPHSLRCAHPLIRNKAASQVLGYRPWGHNNTLLVLAQNYDLHTYLAKRLYWPRSSTAGFRSGTVTCVRLIATIQRRYLPHGVPRLNKLAVRVKQSCAWIPLGDGTGDPAA